MRIFLNNYYDTQYEELALTDFNNLLSSCTSKEDVSIHVKDSNDDTGYMELPYNLGMKIISLLNMDINGTINIYPDSTEVYDYGFDIYIDF